MTQKKISKIYAKDILKSMFDDYTFDFRISLFDDDCILFDIVSKIDADNKQITIYLSKISDKKNQIKVEMYTSSECYETLGIYYIDNKEFVKSDNFWENMFIEHLF